MKKAAAVGAPCCLQSSFPRGASTRLDIIHIQLWLPIFHHLCSQNCVFVNAQAERPIKSSHAAETHCMAEDARQRLHGILAVTSCDLRTKPSRFPFRKFLMFLFRTSVFHKLKILEDFVFLSGTQTKARTSRRIA